jgi:hypothetical protein
VRTCGRRDVRLPIDAPWPSGSKLSREHIGQHAGGDEEVEGGESEPQMPHRLRVPPVADLQNAHARRVKR